MESATSCLAYGGKTVSMLTWFVEAVIYNFEVQGKMVVMIFTRLIIQQEAKFSVS